MDVVKPQSNRNGKGGEVATLGIRHPDQNPDQSYPVGLGRWLSG